MAIIKNRAWMTTTTTGTGTITLVAAVTGYQSFADAGVADGDVVQYVIVDGINWEIGTGTYSSSGPTLTRTVIESTNGDAAINLSGAAEVFIAPLAADIPLLSEAQTWMAIQRASVQTVSDNTAHDFSAAQSFRCVVNGSAFDLLNPSVDPANNDVFISILFEYTTSHGVNLGTDFKATGWTPSATAGMKDQTFWRYYGGAYWLVGFRNNITA